jgi:hypothetical protein
MPILRETDPLRKRRTPVWLLVLAVVVLPLVGLFAWSFHRPVQLLHGRRGILFGRVPINAGGYSSPRGQSYVWGTIPAYELRYFKLPGGRKTGWYMGAWYWL